MSLSIITFISVSLFTRWKSPSGVVTQLYARHPITGVCTQLTLVSNAFTLNLQTGGTGMQATLTATDGTAHTLWSGSCAGAANKVYFVP